MSVATENCQLEGLKAYSKVIADTGDIEAIRQFQPEGATTNPSLILKAVQDERYRGMFESVIKEMKGLPLARDELVSAIIDSLLITWGCEILKAVKSGRVSTEIDARLSYDKEQSLERARELIRLYEAQGIERDRIYVKLASTWEGIQAGRQLESEGINCNMTLLFCLPQAAACFDANASVVSPFVGRIYDWYKKRTGEDYQGKDDPGVQSVAKIFHYARRWGAKTEILGASFRNTGQIINLAGCDMLTISPDLLEELEKTEGTVEKALCPEESEKLGDPKMEMCEADFRFQLNEDPMANDLLSDGIRRFVADTRKLEELILAELS